MGVVVLIGPPLDRTWMRGMFSQKGKILLRDIKHGFRWSNSLRPLHL